MDGYKVKLMEEKIVRRRINVSTSVKGVHTFEATVEITNGTQADILEESDSLVAALDARYPAVEEVKK